MVNGINMVNFPMETPDEDLTELIRNQSLPESPQVNIIEKRKSKNINVTNINSESAKNLVSNIDFHESNKLFFGKPIYCKPIRETTPNKNSYPLIEEKLPGDTFDTESNAKHGEHGTSS